MIDPRRVPLNVFTLHTQWGSIRSFLRRNLQYSKQVRGQKMAGFCANTMSGPSDASKMRVLKKRKRYLKGAKNMGPYRRLKFTLFAEISFDNSSILGLDGAHAKHRTFGGPFSCSCISGQISLTSCSFLPSYTSNFTLEN